MLFFEICFAFKLSQELGEGKTAAGIFGGIAFREIPAAAVIASEGIGNVLAHAVTFAGPEKGLGGEFLFRKALGKGIE